MNETQREYLCDYIDAIITLFMSLCVFMFACFMCVVKLKLMF